jgi:uncharacterized cofD-like protein
VIGESLIPEAKGRISRLRCIPECPKTLPEVVEAIQHAELIILGPGSLYTSVLPNLLIAEIAHAISLSRAPKLYVANIMTQPGETDSYTVGDHVQAILSHCNESNIVNGVIVNNWLPEALLEKYQSYGYHPVELDRERCESLGVQVVEKLLVDEAEQHAVRHNPTQLARSIIQWFKHEYSKLKLPVPGSQPTVLPAELPTMDLEVPSPEPLQAQQ